MGGKRKLNQRSQSISSSKSIQNNSISIHANSRNGEHHHEQDEEEERRLTQRTRYNPSSKSGNRNNSMWSSSGCSSSASRRGKRGSVGGSRSASSLNEAAIGKMFSDIADEDDPTVATMEGICKLCEELKIDPMSDVRILVLMWKMGANDKPGQINREEWSRGCEKLQVDSYAKFQSLLPSLETGFLDRGDFREFFKFCFQFNRQGTHKTLDKDLVAALISMTLNERIANDRLTTFTEFLNSVQDASYDRITLDQWTSFLDFCHECEDLNDYDEENSAWPTLIDDYVEYMENLRK